MEEFCVFCIFLDQRVNARRSCVHAWSNAKHARTPSLQLMAMHRACARVCAGKQFRGGVSMACAVHAVKAGTRGVSFTRVVAEAVEFDLIHIY